jgi:hypothetical protein
MNRERPFALHQEDRTIRASLWEAWDQRHRMSQSRVAETSQRHPNTPITFSQLNFFTETFHYSDKSRYFGSHFPIGLRAFVYSREMPCLAHRSVTCFGSFIQDWKKSRWRALPLV